MKSLLSFLNMYSKVHFKVNLGVKVNGKAREGALGVLREGARVMAKIYLAQINVIANRFPSKLFVTF